MGNAFHNPPLRQRVLVLASPTRYAMETARLHDLGFVHDLHCIDVARLLHADLGREI